MQREWRQQQRKASGLSGTIWTNRTSFERNQFNETKSEKAASRGNAAKLFAKETE